MNATLEQLDKMKALAIEGEAFTEACFVMDINITDTELIENLRMAHDMGLDEKEELEHQESLEEPEPELTEKERKHNTRQFSNFSYSGLINVLTQNNSNKDDLSQDFLKDSLDEMVEKMQKGDTGDILTVLTTNLMQIQLFNGKVTGLIAKDLSYKNYELLSRMQMKLLQESRKTTMAINEICNPKRATFVKNATQNNHTHLNSEKNKINQNEKQNALTEPSSPNEAEGEILEAEYAEK